MTPLIPSRPSPDPGGAAPHGMLDPRMDRETQRARWAVQAARWRTEELARIAFGSGVEVRMEGSPGRPGLQGLIHLQVPFLDLDDHRAREAIFLGWVGADELLQAVPLLFVFGVGSIPDPSAPGLPPLPEGVSPFPPLSVEGR